MLAYGIVWERERRTVVQVQGISVMVELGGLNRGTQWLTTSRIGRHRSVWLSETSFRFLAGLLRIMALLCVSPERTDRVKNADLAPRLAIR